MPLNLTLTEGVLSKDQEKVAIARISEAFLKRHALTGNTVMTPNLTAHLNVLPRGATFSGGKEVDGAWIEMRTPSFALADRAVQTNFFKDATDIIHELSGGKLPEERIWSNGVHTVDGTWNMNVTAMTNSELGATIAKG